MGPRQVDTRGDDEPSSGGDPLHGWRPTSALVTSADDVLAARLIAHLRALGCQVVGVLGPNAPSWRLPAGTALVRGELHHADDVRDALHRFERPPEVCFYLPPRLDDVRALGAGADGPEATHLGHMALQQHAASAQVVAEACLDHGVPALVFASTAAVLADIASPQGLDETARVHPTSLAAHAAWAAERTLRELPATGRAGVALLRFFTVGGAADGDANHDRAERWFVSRALRAAAGLAPPVGLCTHRADTADGTAIRDHVHIDDAVVALRRAAGLVMQRALAGETGVDLIHVGSGVGHSARAVLAMIEEVTGRKVPVVPSRDATKTPSRRVARPDRLRRRLGLSPDGDLQRIVGDAASALGLPRRLVSGCDDPIR